MKTETYLFTENINCLVDYFNTGRYNQITTLMKDYEYELTDLKFISDSIQFKLYDEDGFIGNYITNVSYIPIFRNSIIKTETI